MSENTFAAGLAPAVQRLPHDSLCTARPNSAQPVPNLPSPSVPQLVVPLPAEIVPQPVGQLARANSAAARGRIPAPPAAQSDSWQEHWGRNTKLPSRHLPAPIFLPAPLACAAPGTSQSPPALTINHEPLTTDHWQLTTDHRSPTREPRHARRRTSVCVTGHRAHPGQSRLSPVRRVVADLATIARPQRHRRPPHPRQADGQPPAAIE